MGTHSRRWRRRVAVALALVTAAGAGGARLAPPTHAQPARPALVGLRGLPAAGVLAGRVVLEAAVAVPPGAAVDRVEFALAAPCARAHTERAAPYYFLGDSGPQEDPPHAPTGWDTATCPDGSYTLTVSVFDTAGRADQGEITFRVQQTAPPPAAATPTTPTATAANTPTATATPTATPAAGPAAATPAPGAAGLSGVYFDHADLTGPVLTRVDPQVDFAWGAGAPDPRLGPDTFSVRWTGEVRAERSEAYTFSTTSNDGVRLWVDGRLLVDHWADHPPAEDAGAIGLEAGRWYPLRLEYYEGAGTATIRLAYASPGTPKQTVPGTHLRAAAPAPAGPPGPTPAATASPAPAAPPGATATPAATPAAPPAGRVSGALTVWHPVTVDFAGPAARETDDAPNPFLDYRLQVAFTGPAGQVYDVPGFFDGDGRGGGAGGVWRARFAPDQAGPWRYAASFRAGPAVAVDPAPAAGAPAGFDGAAGGFAVAPRDPAAPGFLKWGRLEYAGGHYLKFRDGPHWLKGGTGSPENLLGYAGFDGGGAGGARHAFAPHAGDWRPGDPVFDAAGPDGGRGLIGAVNYLAARRVNSVYFLPMNIGGDGRDTWPFVGPVDPHGSPADDNRHYRLARLGQWETAFAHLQHRGVHLHVVLDEAEPATRTELDGGTLGVERRLFYRELVARFAHHNALQWNLAEEYDGVVAPEHGIDYPGIPAARVRAYAGHLQALDPYDHPITVHQWRDPDVAWAPFVGDPRFSLTSFQYVDSVAGHGAAVEAWRARTRAAGRPLPVALDEVRALTPANAAAQRKEVLWPTYLSGGHLEWFLGAADQSLEDFRPYEAMWDYTWYARRFLEEHLPFWEMEPQDALLAGAAAGPGGVGGQVLARPGAAYAVYLPAAAVTGTLDLSGAPGRFEKRWYNPRTGAFEGPPETVAGGGPLPLGPPPHTPAEDWAMLLRRAP